MTATLEHPYGLEGTLSMMCLRRPDDMVVAAIISLQDPVGSHLDDIMHWIQVLSCLPMSLSPGICSNMQPCATDAWTDHAHLAGVNLQTTDVNDVIGEAPSSTCCAACRTTMRYLHL